MTSDRQSKFVGLIELAEILGYPTTLGGQRAACDFMYRRSVQPASNGSLVLFMRTDVIDAMNREPTQ